ncbi:MAG: 50S ribosomal protein L6, partial [Candidatus Yanofskybacteria bacterium RIFCSPHIGHO2_02_FULL_39_10]
MSKIGKKIIEIPKGVEVKIDADSVWAKGPKGELKKTFHDSVSISVEGNNIIVKNKKTDSPDTALWGLVRSLLANMIKGVNEGFEKNLEFEGIGYKASVKGDNLELNLGYSHPIFIKAPAGIEFKVDKNVIKISGID